MKFVNVEDRIARSRLARPAPFPDVGLLALRLAAGVTFLVHGVDKLGDRKGTEQFFGSLGIPAPKVMAPFVALTETVGGAALIAGLGAPVAAAALTIDMLVAFGTAHAEPELELLLAAASATIVLAGAGRLSVDHVLGASR